MKVKSAFAPDLPQAELQEFSIDLSGMKAGEKSPVFFPSAPRVSMALETLGYCSMALECVAVVRRCSMAL